MVYFLNVIKLLSALFFLFPSIRPEEAEQHRAKLVEAYEYILLNVGISAASAAVWWDYVNFIKGNVMETKEAERWNLGMSDVRILHVDYRVA